MARPTPCFPMPHDRLLPPTRLSHNCRRQKIIMETKVDVTVALHFVGTAKSYSIHTSDGSVSFDNFVGQATLKVVDDSSTVNLAASVSTKKKTVKGNTPKTAITSKVEATKLTKVNDTKLVGKKAATKATAPTKTTAPTKMTAPIKPKVK